LLGNCVNLVPDQRTAVQ